VPGRNRGHSQVAGERAAAKMMMEYRFLLNL
jgi:hypothetical protein